ncbi:MAG: hypothetical protein LC732_03300 [Acidobacteria bacterium]|nr:hypothetical protein [Acidobacteriota bacterium]
MAISLPLGIILALVLVNRYEERLQARIHWVYILMALLTIPYIYDSPIWGFRFWLAVTMFFLAVALLVLHFHERKKQERG